MAAYDVIVIGGGLVGGAIAWGAAKLGAHVATLPPNVLRMLYGHPLTDKGLAAFLADWAKTGQAI